MGDERPRTVHESELISALDAERLRATGQVLELEGPAKNVVDLRGESEPTDDSNRQQYDSDDSVERYKNFLDWLFSTFKTTGDEFRQQWIRPLDLRPGQRVLVTGCGLGEDIANCVDAVGDTGFVHAQDLSSNFVHHSAGRYKGSNVVFTISNALDLPYKDDYFDAVCHFGGINLFGDMTRAISEMNRVCKVGGRIQFGDESVAPHLRNTDYGRMFIVNNELWRFKLPLEELPSSARDISVNFVLGNCFYVIGFTKGRGYPSVDIDVPHVGLRGGSVRKRYGGQLEGVDRRSKEKIYDFAKREGKSVTEVLEDLINQAL